MRNDQLVLALRNAARTVARTRSIRDLHQTLGHVVTCAVETIPGVDAGGISMTEDGTVVPRSPTNEAVAELDALQSSLGEGPCISAILEPPEDGLIVARDLAGADAERWPRFAPRAVHAGYRSMMSIELSSCGPTRASLNLYAHEPCAFNAEARLMAGLFGVQAALLLYGSEQAVHLQRALDTRDVISQAKGILMERFTLDDASAFNMLVTSSQETNVKLVNVARWLHDDANERSRSCGGAVSEEPA